jgi:hypothetical protein
MGLIDRNQIEETEKMRNEINFKLDKKEDIIDKLQLSGQNLGWVFNSRSVCMCVVHLCCFEAKQPNLMLKTRPKQLCPLAFALPEETHKYTTAEGERGERGKGRG